MKRFSPGILPPLAVAGLILSACDSPTSVDVPIGVEPSFAAVSSTSTVKVSLAYPSGVPCGAGGSGESVAVFGTWLWLIHTTENKNRVTVRTVSNPQQVLGEGFTTGDTYHGVGIEQQTFTGSFVNGQLTKTLVSTFLLIGEGKDNNFRVRLNTQLTVNEGGTVTATVDDFSVECG